jgi:hypothetical protein
LTITTTHLHRLTNTIVTTTTIINSTATIATGPKTTMITANVTTDRAEIKTLIVAL